MNLIDSDLHAKGHFRVYNKFFCVFPAGTQVLGQSANLSIAW